MARAKNKKELLDFSKKQYLEILQLINSLSELQQNTSFLFETDRDKNFRDLLIHLFEWQNLFIHWFEKNIIGIKSPFLPSPYNFKNYPQMNIEFWQQHQTTSLSEAKELLAKSHAKIILIIEKISEENLFTKKYFDWTGTTSLGSYAVSATSSHYDWALKFIKKQIKLLAKINNLIQ